MKRQENKGLTLIELLIVLGISGIVITISMSFFITNVKTFNRSGNEIELQQQGQITMEYIIERVLPSKGIEEIRDKNGINALSRDSVDINKVIFKTEDSEGNESGEIFELKLSNKLFHGRGISGSATTEVANYITSISLSVISADIDKFNFKNARAVQIELTLEKDDKNIVLVNQVYFRNFDD